MITFIDLTEARLIDFLLSCDCGDVNNRPRFHAGDECYFPSRALAERIAGQLFAKLTNKEADKYEQRLTGTK